MHTVRDHGRNVAAMNETIRHIPYTTHILQHTDEQDKQDMRRDRLTREGIKRELGCMLGMG